MNALTTSRLLLRPIIPQDWLALKKITRDFAASPYWMYDYPFPSEDEKLKAIASHFSKTGTFLSVLLKETGEMIGYKSLKLQAFQSLNDRIDLWFYTFYTY